MLNDFAFRVDCGPRCGSRRPFAHIALSHFLRGNEGPVVNVYRIAQEGEFSPAQFAAPRLIAATARIRF